MKKLLIVSLLFGLAFSTFAKATLKNPGDTLLMVPIDKTVSMKTKGGSVHARILVTNATDNLATAIYYSYDSTYAFTVSFDSGVHMCVFLGSLYPHKSCIVYLTFYSRNVMTGRMPYRIVATTPGGLEGTSWPYIEVNLTK